MAVVTALSPGNLVESSLSGEVFGLPRSNPSNLIVVVIGELNQVPQGLVVEVSLDGENWVSLTGDVQQGEANEPSGFQISDIIGNSVRFRFTSGVEKYQIMLG